MGSGKGHRQFKQLKREIFNSDQKFPGYPHRRHRKDRPAFRQSEVRRIKEMAHIETLTEELSEII